MIPIESSVKYSHSDPAHNTLVLPCVSAYRTPLTSIWCLIMDLSPLCLSLRFLQSLKSSQISSIGSPAAALIIIYKLIFLLPTGHNDYMGHVAQTKLGVNTLLIQFRLNNTLQKPTELQL